MIRPAGGATTCQPPPHLSWRFYASELPYPGSLALSVAKNTDTSFCLIITSLAALPRLIDYPAAKLTALGANSCSSLNLAEMRDLQGGKLASVAVAVTWRAASLPRGHQAPAHHCKLKEPGYHL